MLAVESAPNGFQRTTEQVRRASVDANANQQETYQEDNALAHWARRIVSLEDTSAQWLMTIFSILAAFLLWRTLQATQRMATDTRQIGEAQVRAYLTIERVLVYLTPGDQFPFIKVMIRNSGQSPARRVRIVVKFDRTMKGDGTSVLTATVPPVAFPESDVQAGSLTDKHFCYVQSLALDTKDFGEGFERLIMLNAKVAVFARDVFGADAMDNGYFMAGWTLAEDRNLPKDMVRFDGFPFTEGEINEMRGAVNF